MMPPVFRAMAAGGVLIIARDRQYHVCLVRRGRHQRQAWCLPKGHLEAGEDAAAAARREVREETGWFGEILQALPSISYQFTAPDEGGRILKTVSFFLMRATVAAEGPRDTQEVEEVRWVVLDEAIRMAAYENERRVLREAQQVLQQHPIPNL